MRVEGRVVKFDMDRGIGFVRPSDTNYTDAFIHRKNIEPNVSGFKKLAVGDIIDFEYVIEDRGPVAKDIKIINTIFVGEDYDNRGNR